MARELKHMMSPQIEAAPFLIGFPLRTSNTPKLETIREERAEEFEDEDDFDDEGNDNDDDQ
ncbi:hypothetical protein PTKIN_Ptkin03bG0019700 [Pterospermum kingtungense]